MILRFSDVVLGAFATGALALLRFIFRRSVAGTPPTAPAQSRPPWPSAAQLRDELRRLGIPVELGQIEQWSRREFDEAAAFAVAERRRITDRPADVDGSEWPRCLRERRLA
jgi:hypothetical protein